MHSLELAILADDLSGAAECASVVRLRVSRSVVLLRSQDCHGGLVSSNRVVTVDTNTRQATPHAAADIVREAARLVATAPLLLKKVDSLLRGNLASEVQAIAAELGRVAVVAVSNPRWRRIVRDGVLRVDGTPLSESGLWHAEGRTPPSSVAEALQPLECVLVDQDVVAAGPESIVRLLSKVTDPRTVAICDAETEHDLATVVEAARSASAQPLLVGSAALVAAAAQTLPLDRASYRKSSEGTEPRAQAAVPSLPALLVALGTRATIARTQLARVAGSAAYIELVSPKELLADPHTVAARLARVPAEGLVVVALDPTAPADPDMSSRLTPAFADAVAAAAGRFPALFLSGGETARAVLDRIGVEALTVRAELEPGTVVSSAPRNQVVVTRPGSYGDADSLVRATRQLLRQPATDKEHP